ncbi:MAG TPA: class I SAM-dependent methyltransferase [Gaiellales bacterium]|nr:class I SAM-dependent methyltransferase [Gaiellales bacterium]
MTKLDDADLVAREYATLDRLAMRRLDRTGWLRGDDEPWLIALRAAAEQRPNRILEVGCGTGEFAALLTAPEVVCVDASPAAVDAARSKGLTAHVGDAQGLPFPDASFDVVVANWMLYHVPDRARAIAELARVLRPGGRFVGCYNAPDHLRELWASVGVPADTGGFGAATGSEELGRAFAVVEARRAETEVLWESRERVQAYLDAYREMYGPLTAPTEPYPFRATRRNVVFVATKP